MLAGLYLAVLLTLVMFVLGLQRLCDGPARAVGTMRSCRWPALRRKYLALHPHCAACGGTEQVEPHHKIPFHLDPDKELDADNLVTLCNKHGCHFAFGHNYDWKAFNSHVGEDVRIQAMRVKQRRYE